MSRRRRVLHVLSTATAALVAAGMFAGLPASGATGASDAGALAASQPAVTPERASLVQMVVPDQQALNHLIAQGVDLAEYARQTADGIRVYAVVTPTELSRLRAQGVRVERTVETSADAKRRRADRAAAVTEQRQATAEQDTVTIQRATWFRESGSYFINVKAHTSAGIDPEVILTAHWRGTGHTSGQATLARHADAGKYLDHELRRPVPTDSRPLFVTISSSNGGSATARVTQWPAGKKPHPTHPGYEKDFVTHYMTPEDVYQRIEKLHAEFPKLTDIIDLPYRTNGYRRHAQALLGATRSTAVVVTSKAYGSDGGNALSIELVDPGAPNQPLRVSVSGDAVTVSLATDASGNPTSTAAEVADAITNQAADLMTATTYRGDAGDGVVEPTSSPVSLSDFLDAPASVPREPFQVRALRIGVHRDGSRIGVLAYAQEHAREWVTPLVAVEAAERLLRNYATDPTTRKLLQRTDIFVIPSVNPDGANYSFYDFNFQRKNMTNHCPPAESGPGLRNRWGVDVNRNYSVGSIFDGYFGASHNCLSGVYAGPAELSEPESSNVAWLANHHPNIKFAMNIHSFGGYFMWPPGAYKLDGRVSLPRPTAEEEAFFEKSAGRIERAIAAERGTVTWPQQTGPVVDVLYSAAGNSADQVWYENDIFGWDFEVGSDRWNAEAQRWEGVGFQPPFSEGHAEAMEYASGLIALIGVAADYQRHH